MSPWVFQEQHSSWSLLIYDPVGVRSGDNLPARLSLLMTMTRSNSLRLEKKKKKMWTGTPTSRSRETDLSVDGEPSPLCSLELGSGIPR